MNNATKNELLYAAELGHRIELVREGDKPKRLWAGLGNRTGLHDFQHELTAEKFENGGARLAAKLNALPTGARVSVRVFRNINRDRGTWDLVRSMSV